MLRADRAPLPPDVATELRDALRRRQKELPARWLAAVDAEALHAGATSLPSHEHEQLERDLGLGLVRDALAEMRPRGIVCVKPSASSVNRTLTDALRERGSVTAIAAAELDTKLAIEMLDRVVTPGVRDSSSAIACDCTIELPLPDTFPRPRVYLCLGNVLGATTAVGAVRMLRILRTTMTPTDALILGLETRNSSHVPGTVDSRFEAAASRHLGALDLLNNTAGAAFDLSRFEYRSTFDSENDRYETHLVARRAIDVEIPGVCDVRFRKGESIRTSVRCRFDRNRVTAMTAGVGLTIRNWVADPAGRFAVALATATV